MTELSLEQAQALIGNPVRVMRVTSSPHGLRGTLVQVRKKKAQVRFGKSSQWVSIGQLRRWQKGEAEAPGVDESEDLPARGHPKKKKLGRVAGASVRVEAEVVPEDPDRHGGPVAEEPPRRTLLHGYGPCDCDSACPPLDEEPEPEDVVLEAHRVLVTARGSLTEALEFERLAHEAESEAERALEEARTTRLDAHDQVQRARSAVLSAKEAAVAAIQGDAVDGEEEEAGEADSAEAEEGE